MLSTRLTLQSRSTVWSTLLPRYCELLSTTSAFKSKVTLSCKTNQLWECSQVRPLVSVSCSTARNASLRPLISCTVSANNVLCASKRHMAKGKDKKKDKITDKPKVMLPDEEMEKVIAFEDWKLHIEAIIDEFKNDLKMNYNVRMNPRMIETLEVSYDGVQVALADIVTIARKQDSFVLNMAATPQAIKPTMIALNESGLGLNPQQDGTVIFIRMPKVTTEHRQALIKGVKVAGQKVKDAIKDQNLQKKFMVKDTKKLSQDLQTNAKQMLQFYIKQKHAIIDEIVNQKSESLLNN